MQIPFKEFNFRVTQKSPWLGLHFLCNTKIYISQFFSAWSKQCHENYLTCNLKTKCSILETPVLSVYGLRQYTIYTENNRFPSFSICTYFILCDTKEKKLGNMWFWFLAHALWWFTVGSQQSSLTVQLELYRDWQELPASDGFYGFANPDKSLLQTVIYTKSKKE